MRTLAAEYPDEAHFMAHLGRFYDKEMRDYEKAVSCVERALLLEPDNSSIHHMKGMALRSQASGMIERREPLSDVNIRGHESQRIFRSLARKVPGQRAWIY